MVGTGNMRSKTFKNLVQILTSRGTSSYFTIFQLSCNRLFTDKNVQSIILRPEIKRFYGCDDKRVYLLQK